MNHIAMSRRVRFHALGVLLLGGVVLATPGRAGAVRAGGALPGCGVCDPADDLCTEEYMNYRIEQCHQICGSDWSTGECYDGIPGGVTCHGPGVYQTFWWCYGG